MRSLPLNAGPFNPGPNLALFLRVAYKGQHYKGWRYKGHFKTPIEHLKIRVKSLLYDLAIAGGVTAEVREISNSNRIRGKAIWD